jgi:hypothetical protein
LNIAIHQKVPLDIGPRQLRVTYEWLKGCVSSSVERVRSELRITQIRSGTRRSEADFRSFLTVSETSTEQLPIPDDLEEQLANLFSIANDGLFDDDQTNRFSEKLAELIYRYGDGTIIGLAPFIIGEQASAESAAATLRCLSHLDSPISYNYRIWLMERALQSTSSWIRDAAALALESLDDPSAIPYLQEAFSKEPNAELRKYLFSVCQFLLRKR